MTGAIERSESTVAWRGMLGRLTGRYWILALAVPPLVRLLLMISPDQQYSRFQVAEINLWLSGWLAEIAVILVALQRGMRSRACFESLPKAVRVLAIVWVLALAVSTVTASAHPSLALMGGMGWLVHGLFGFSVWFLVSQGPVSAEKQFGLFCRVYPVITIVIGLFLLVFVLRIEASGERNWVSMLPGFAHIRHTGYLFAPALAICFARIAIAPKTNAWAMILLAGNAALCLWFGSRGPFFALAAGIAVAAVLCSSVRHRGTVWQVSSSLVLGGLLSLSVPTPDQDGFGGVARMSQTSENVNQFSTGRLNFWAEAAELTAKRPLFGYGVNQFQFTSQIADGRFRHPHNFVMQVFFDWGIVGGSAFLGLFAFAVAGILRRRGRATQSYPIAVAGFTTMAALAAIDGIFYYPTTLALTVLFLVMALQRIGEKVPGDLE